MLPVVFTVVAAATIGAATARNTPDITLTVTPLRAVYHRGEPIALRISIRNNGEKAVELGIGPSPTAFVRGLLFQFVRRGAPKPPRTKFEVFDFVVPEVRVLPGVELRRVIALNRYVAFDTTGRFTIDYGAFENVPRGSGERTAWEPVTWRGTFEIHVEPGPIDQRWIEDLIESLGNSVRTRPARVHNTSDFEPMGVADLLQWTDSPAVVEPLVRAAMSVPNSSAEIVVSLRNFFKGSERVRTAILDLGRDCELGACIAAIDVYNKEGVAIPRSWLRDVITANGGKTWFALEYLREHGAKEDLDLVEPLIACENKLEANHAREVAEALRARESVKPRQGTNNH